VPGYTVPVLESTNGADIGKKKTLNFMAFLILAGSFFFEDYCFKRTIVGTEAALDAFSDINRRIIRTFIDCSALTTGSASSTLIAVTRYYIRHKKLSCLPTLTRFPCRATEVFLTPILYSSNFH
jgi:hypothetical protein